MWVLYSFASPMSFLFCCITKNSCEVHSRMHSNCLVIYIYCLNDVYSLLSCITLHTLMVCGSAVNLHQLICCKSTVNLHPPIDSGNTLTLIVCESLLICTVGKTRVNLVD